MYCVAQKAPIVYALYIGITDKFSPPSSHICAVRSSSTNPRRSTATPVVCLLAEPSKSQVRRTQAIGQRLVCENVPRMQARSAPHDWLTLTAIDTAHLCKSGRSHFISASLSHHSNHKLNGITKADRQAQMSEDLLHRDFHADTPLSKCVTDMTEIPACDGKLYISALFDCYDAGVLGLSMDTNMRASLCVQMLDNAMISYPMLRGAILHSDRGSQYTSQLYREAIQNYGIRQSMNSAGGRCHDNARCESMWARMKSELLYGRYDTKNMTTQELKVLVWRYFMSYWNNRRICSTNGGLPPMVKRRQFYDSIAATS